jgi:hypothetical protein
MKKIILALIFLISTSFTLPLSDTWDGNTGSQLCTGNAIRDGATAAGLYTITTTIPAELDKKVLTKAELATYTSIPTDNVPMNALSSNQCPTKDQILGTF